METKRDHQQCRPPFGRPPVGRPQLEKTPICGAVHIHTHYSDGGVSMEDTISAAQAAGLDFILVTDHNTLAGKKHEGYHGNLLVAVDVEVSPSMFHGHCFALGLPDYAGIHRLRTTEARMHAITEQGGFCWVPHPRGFFNAWVPSWNAAWKQWLPEIRAIEIGSFLVEWVERLRPWNFRRMLRDPKGNAASPASATLALWDFLNARPGAPLMYGFVGIDAHYRQVLGGRVHTPTYEELFATHNLQVWMPRRTGEASADLHALRAALREGAFVNIVRAWQGREPLLFAQNEEGMLQVHAAQAEGGSIRLLRDGVSVLEKQVGELAFQPNEPGVYRAEVFRDGRIWALTNPIRVPPELVPTPSQARRAVAWTGERV